MTLGLILDEEQLHKCYIKKLNKRFGIKEMQRKKVQFGIPIIERKKISRNEVLPRRLEARITDNFWNALLMIY